MRNAFGLAALTGAIMIAIGTTATAPAVARDGRAAGGGGGQGLSAGGAGSSMMPHGFSQGQKQGWSGRRPPGWHGHGQKQGWGNGKALPGLSSH